MVFIDFRGFQATNIEGEHRNSNIGNRNSNIEHRTSSIDVEHRNSEIENRPKPTKISECQRRSTTINEHQRQSTNIKRKSMKLQPYKLDVHRFSLIIVDCSLEFQFSPPRFSIFTSSLFNFHLCDFQFSQSIFSFHLLSFQLSSSILKFHVFCCEPLGGT